MSKYLITGGIGFIGSTLSEDLLKEGHDVTVVDNFDPYYSRTIKEKNLISLKSFPLFKFFEIDICDYSALESQIIGEYEAIIHIAAKAGIRSSILNPIKYHEVNVMGTQNMLEFARLRNIRQFVFASSSSIYGNNPNIPWKESDQNHLPISPYASSKLGAEYIGHVYSHLHEIRFLALRFFTVYGPRQRPDLAIYKFMHKIINDEPIPVFGDGSTKRDYTYVQDIVNGIKSAISYRESLFEIINLGNNHTISLSEMITCIEEVIDKKAIINRLPDQAGDVSQTYADITKARKLLRYEPKTTFIKGLENLYNWYQSQNQDKQ